MQRSEMSPRRLPNAPRVPAVARRVPTPRSHDGCREASPPPPLSRPPRWQPMMYRIDHTLHCLPPRPPTMAVTSHTAPITRVTGDVALADVFSHDLLPLGRCKVIRIQVAQHDSLDHPPRPQGHGQDPIMNTTRDAALTPPASATRPRTGSDHEHESRCCAHSTCLGHNATYKGKWTSRSWNYHRFVFRLMISPPSLRSEDLSHKRLRCGSRGKLSATRQTLLPILVSTDGLLQGLVVLIIHSGTQLQPQQLSAKAAATLSTAVLSGCISVVAEGPVALALRLTMMTRAMSVQAGRRLRKAQEAARDLDAFPVPTRPR